MALSRPRLRWRRRRSPDLLRATSATARGALASHRHFQPVRLPLQRRRRRHLAADQADSAQHLLGIQLPLSGRPRFELCAHVGGDASAIRPSRLACPPAVRCGTARPESAKQDLEMVTSTRQVTRLPREHEHVMPLVALVNTTPCQLPILRIPLTDRLVASFLAQAVGVQVDGTDGVIMTANRPVIPPSSDSKGGPTQVMKVFRGLLLAHVFFALPLIVIFFPRYGKESKNFLLSLFDRNEASNEKMIVLALFVIHTSLGSLGVLLAHIADGPVCTGIVGSLTLWIIISVVGFVDYIFLKTLPDEGTYQLVFLVHFIVMLLVICGLWAKFVGFSQCCCSKQDQSQRLPF